MWTIALSLLKRFWPAAVGMAALLAGWLWHVGELREARADERQKVTLAYQKALQDVITKRAETLREVEAKHAQEIERLSERVNIHLSGPPIRMCNAISVRAPEDPGTLAGSAEGESTRRADVDLRPAIVRRGEVCERLRQQLITIGELQ